jgi:hypothetical protein
MSRLHKRKRPEHAPATCDLGSEIEAISAMTIDQLRDRWMTKHRFGPPAALTKDLLARALCQQIQEERLGGLDRPLRRLLSEAARSGASPAPRIKVGSVIVREHQGRVHEVVVTPDGFLWAGETYASLSTIARKITGTSWNGPRFFGLRGRAGGPGLSCRIPQEGFAARTQKPALVRRAETCEPPLVQMEGRP